MWWQVGSSATLGDNSQMIGNILATASITIDPGATLNGRALAGAVSAGSGAVTLAGGTPANQVNGPTCATVTTVITTPITTVITSTITGIIIPEYQWGVLLLLILMLLGYMLLKRRTRSH